MKMTRSLVEDRAFVFDPSQQSVSVQKDAKVTNGSDTENFWVFDLPARTQPDCWDLFMNEEATKIWPVTPTESPVDGFFIGRFSLQGLGFRNQLLRRNGKLDKVYIVKPRRGRKVVSDLSG